MFYMSFSQENGILYRDNMSKIKKFFQTVWDYITLPYYWITTIGVDKKLLKLAEEDRTSLTTEKDVEFLKSLGVDVDLETLRNGKSAMETRGKFQFIAINKSGLQNATRLFLFV